MSLYSEYIKEREDFETIELQDSFLTYEINLNGTLCYICDLFIRPKKRRNGKEYLKLAREVIKRLEKSEVKFIFCNVIKGMELTDYVLNIHKKTGWVSHSENDEKFYLKISFKNFKERFN